MNRFAGKAEAVRQAVIEGPAELDTAVRRELFDGRPGSQEAAFIDKVRRHAYKVVDGDIGDLRAAGWSADQIFELVVATALGEGYQRIKAGLDALEAR